MISWKLLSNPHQELEMRNTDDITRRDVVKMAGAAGAAADQRTSQPSRKSAPPTIRSSSE